MLVKVYATSLFYRVMFNIFKCNRNFRNMLDKYLLSICTALNKINVFCKSQLNMQCSSFITSSLFSASFLEGIIC